MPDTADDQAPVDVVPETDGYQEPTDTASDADSDQGNTDVPAEIPNSNNPASISAQLDAKDFQPDQQDEAFRKLQDYMNDHNYGREDFSTYSKDPEWRVLQREAFPDYELPPIADTPEEAFDRLQDYMNSHNYGRDDFAEYSQDPTWRELQSIAFPDYELPPVMDRRNETDIPQGVDTVQDKRLRPSFFARAYKQHKRVGLFL